MHWFGKLPEMITIMTGCTLALAALDCRSLTGQPVDAGGAPTAVAGAPAQPALRGEENSISAGRLIAAADTSGESGTLGQDVNLPASGQTNSTTPYVFPPGTGEPPPGSSNVLQVPLVFTPESSSPSPDWESSANSTGTSAPSATPTQSGSNSYQPPVGPMGLQAPGSVTSVIQTPQSILSVPDPGSIRPSTIGSSNSEQLNRMMLNASGINNSQATNLKVGPMLLSAGSTLSTEFSDNIRSTDTGREADLILNPEVTIEGTLKLTKLNTLTLSLGFGYVWYLNHPDLDSKTLILAPGTNLTYNIKVGPVLLTLYDEPSVAQEQANQLTLRQIVSYGQFSNTAGLTALWDLNVVDLSAGYDHVDSIALQSELDDQNSSEDQAKVTVSYRYSPSLREGIQATLTSVHYSSSLQNSGNTYSVGPFIEARLTKHINVDASAGYQGGNFSSGGQTQDNSSMGSYYASLGISHDLNRFIQQTLSLSHEAQLGTMSNFVTTNTVDYSASWNITDGITLAANGSASNAQESGGIYAQDFDYYTIGLSTSLALSRKLNLNMFYRYTRRAAGSPPPVKGATPLDYYEDELGFILQYTF
jgi:hypothetical protein